MGKAIYKPKIGSPSWEYSEFICNFFKGCSCDCSYCMNKRWGWGTVPTLKKCFKDKLHALEVFEKELEANLPELQKNGMLFSMSTDPFLSETTDITFKAMYRAAMFNVKSKILSKKGDFADFIIRFSTKNSIFELQRYWAFGFTLTNHDEMESGASTNEERIEAMKKLHDAGFKTWCSLEPVIAEADSLDIVKRTRDFCDLYKVGLLSGKKYDKDGLLWLMTGIQHHVSRGIGAKIYFKDSFLKAANINREDLPSCCVGRDYNLFNN